MVPECRGGGRGEGAAAAGPTRWRTAVSGWGRFHCDEESWTHLVDDAGGLSGSCRRSMSGWLLLSEEEGEGAREGASDQFGRAARPPACSRPQGLPPPPRPEFEIPPRALARPSRSLDNPLFLSPPSRSVDVATSSFRHSTCAAPATRPACARTAPLCWTSALATALVSCNRCELRVERVERASH